MDSNHILSYVEQSNKLDRRGFLKGVGYSAGLTLAGSSLLAACGNLSSLSDSGQIAPKGSKVSGSLTIAYLGTADQQKSWNALFALFQKQYPNVKLKAQPNNSNNWAAFFNTLSTQIAGGKIPDIVQVATEGQRLFASRGLVEPIDAYMKRDADELADFFNDIDPHLKTWAKLSSTDGKTYYLPGEFNPMCIWYNSDMFHKAGVNEPDNTWTWDDLKTIAKKLSKPGVYGMQAQSAYFAGIMPWLLTNGANVLNTSWTQSTITTPAAAEALQFMRDLVAQGISPAPGGTFDAFGAMAQGKLAMFGGGRWPIVNIRQLGITNKVKIVAWPRKTQQGSPIGFNAYPIMRASQNKEAAWAFVKFITSKAASQYFASQGGTIVPPRRSVATSDAFLSNAPQGSENLYKALSYGSPLPAPDKENVIELAIDNVSAQILTGNVSVQQGLAQLDQQIKAALS
ncbi:MAG TPA: extracellular solute-binding protein [Ktedonobacteraceae bacterium]|jgi:multiple sugar transport system substrate-binding protein|nr:extracellular solute-binding protein [Ktedonobacteraceae bacterium]